MARNPFKDPSISQKNDADSISSRRGMNKRAKRNSNKRDRQFLEKDLESRFADLPEGMQGYSKEVFEEGKKFYSILTISQDGLFVDGIPWEKHHENKKVDHIPRADTLEV